MMIVACFADECPRDQNGSHYGNIFSPGYLNYIVTHANLFVVLCIFIDYLVTLLPYFATIMPCDTGLQNDISARTKEASYFVVSVDILVVFQVYSALLILPLSFIEFDDKITDPYFYCFCKWLAPLFVSRIISQLTVLSLVSDG